MTFKKLIFPGFTVLMFLAFGNLKAQKKTEDIVPKEVVYKIVGKDSLKAYIFYPPAIESSERKPAVVSFHGGGWAMGRAAYTFGLSKDFARKGLVGISAQYRLADQKEITPLDAMEDAFDLMIWLKLNAEELLLNPDKLIAHGWSAGGHLAACTAVFPKIDSVNNVSSMPSALILYTAALSVVKDNWYKKLLMEKVQPIDFSPAEHLRENIPPAIIIAASKDSTTPVEQSLLFHENMKKYNNESYIHIYAAAHLLSHSNEVSKADKKLLAEAYNEVNLFLEKLGYFE